MATNFDKDNSAITPNAKEIARADGNYTAIVRPNRAKGGWYVAIVNILSGLPVFKFAHVENKEEIGKAIASDLRMMDKCGSNSKMADRSRHRYKNY